MHYVRIDDIRHIAMKMPEEVKRGIEVTESFKSIVGENPEQLEENYYRELLR
ncbi:hypothetical protein [Lysinibacillus contaminans]|uniref:hypothetical protein n=1 Tax=Lysinibacillus contaminans TaxID=1293441 RepID=UPI000ACB5BCD|nr:hypothetical protein [Lysinibacillus contaminans]